jgi:hypothetical protein
MEQLNLYLPNRDLDNLANNVDYNRLAYDGIEIDVDFGVSPAKITIKKGSLIEVNGNLYTATTDEDFTMSLASHNYIVFDGISWSSASGKGTYSPEKQGFYQSDNISKTSKWFIVDGNNTFYIDKHLYLNSNENTFNMTRISKNNFTPGSGQVSFTPDIDTLDEWSTNVATIKLDGLYMLTFNANLNLTAGPQSKNISIQVNAANVAFAQYTEGISRVTSKTSGVSCHALVGLSALNTVTFNTSAGGSNASCSIIRFF